jgi:hypothetical protein
LRFGSPLLSLDHAEALLVFFDLDLNRAATLVIDR